MNMNIWPGYFQNDLGLSWVVNSVTGNLVPGKRQTTWWEPILSHHPRYTYYNLSWDTL